MNQSLITEFAKDFWAGAPDHQSYPRPIERAIAWVLPLAIVRLPTVDIKSVFDWFKFRNIGLCASNDVGKMHGCVVARSGKGILFLDGTNPVNDQRFTIAHECAHFILHYLEPVRRATASFGDVGTDFVDGLETPEFQDRLSAILQRIDLEEYMHFFPQSEGIDMIRYEDDADRLALEILCPYESARVSLSNKVSNPSTELHLELAAEMLESEFGIPKSVSRAYTNWIFGQISPIRSFRDWI
jgi:hypothetical protein